MSARTGRRGLLRRRGAERDRYDRAGAMMRRERQRRRRASNGPQARDRREQPDARGHRDPAASTRARRRLLPTLLRLVLAILRFLLVRGPVRGVVERVERARVRVVAVGSSAAATATTVATVVGQAGAIATGRAAADGVGRSTTGGRRLTEAQRRERARRLRRLRRRLRLVGLVAGVAFAAAVWYQVPRLSLFDVRMVEVVGASAVPDPLIRAQVEAHLEGQTIFTLDVDAVEHDVERFPFVQRAHVDRHFPSGISIAVTEYEPLAFGLSGNAGWLVARDGRVLTRARLADWRDRVPIVRLENDDVDAGDRVGGEPALRLLRATSPLFPGTFRAVEMGANGFVGYMQDGPEIRFGRDTDLTTKLLVAQRLLEMYGRSRQGAITYIDVSVPARPAVMSE